MQRLVAAGMLLMLMGCAAVGVVATDDPGEKLGQAVYLYKSQNRPLPADRLFKEALDIFQSKGNEAGLAETFRQYAYFLVSPSVENWGPHFRKAGFLMNETITYDTRFEKAIKYFQKAGDIYVKNAQYDQLSNVDMIMGKIYVTRIGDQAKGCQYLDKSLADNETFMKANPNAKIQLPEGIENYADYVAMMKEQAKCN